MEASAKEYLRKSLQGECRDGLHADRHDRTVATDAAGVHSELGPRPHDVLCAFKKKSSGDTPNIFLNCVQ